MEMLAERQNILNTVECQKASENCSRIQTSIALYKIALQPNLSDILGLNQQFISGSSIVH